MVLEEEPYWQGGGGNSHSVWTASAEGNREWSWLAWLARHKVVELCTDRGKAWMGRLDLVGLLVTMMESSYLRLRLRLRLHSYSYSHSGWL